MDSDHEFQQAIIDGVAEPLLVIGKDYRVKLMNRAAREALSVASDLSGDKRCYQISHHRVEPCDGIDHPCPLQRVRESGQPVTVVHAHYQKNAGQRYFEVMAAPFWGTEGAFHGIIETMRDITERKRTQDALQQYTERLRSLAAQLTKIAEAERQHLARELHDQVGQNLTVLGINLNIIKAQLPDHTPTEVCFRLDDSLALVDQTAERIRDVMANLRPPVLDDYGLVAALRWYGDQFTKRTGVSVEVAGEEPVPRLTAQVENALFRIAQEALTNVAKHAQASRVKVSLDMSNTSLQLTIADNGIGFLVDRLAEPDDYQGWGLLTIQERSEAVGGSCQIISNPNMGTQVIVEVPR
jgi:signal transduction histidine kinase